MDEVNSKEGSSKHYMIGGDGPNSYSKNSEYQKQLLFSAEELMIQLTNEHLDIEKPPFDPRNAFKIADFGCSVGPNTFIAVKNIIAAVENKYKSNQKNPVTPEFQVFLSDLVGNDFNTLFKNLPPTTRQHFVAAVPGSFHDRLFPDAALHFAHCSTSLQWLSKIPKELTQPSSSAWNKGRVNYFGAAKEVKEAYSHQHREDIKSFLSARAKELVAGGLMVLVMLGFPDGVPSSEPGAALTFDILQSCLEDMAKIGLITEEKMDTFNLPFYFPWPSEVKGLIEDNGLFRIERLTKLAYHPRETSPQILVSHLKATIGELIEEHFGDGVVEELFRRALQKLSKNPLLIAEMNKQYVANFFIFLKRKT